MKRVTKIVLTDCYGEKLRTISFPTKELHPDPEYLAQGLVGGFDKVGDQYYAHQVFERLRLPGTSAHHMELALMVPVDPERNIRILYMIYHFDRVDEKGMPNYRFVTIR